MANRDLSKSYDDFPTKNTSNRKFKKTSFERKDVLHVSIAEQGDHRSKRNLRKDWETLENDYEEHDDFFAK